ncbi:formate-dependent nitrite reductase, membrane component [Desulfosporosinus orientis DSM 765]|uniref:Formate-dependent nitrite reductase, membrane component n=1 Tax=Desulfosporosinus orientis (strain ATCC 19365 / DSM 765 / NCIMB 8382 / VKM B-1628 / Singapore I) TaxID=768706 RepID=G7WAD0_DESOD|nr:NrfD/PsrC family molybdoenzyme membrane anchor subunit [Desulfosporosinus orientis]AET66479.1 formate-dependent nitrite reductase, membrane component [Desulfosporosinus orientis DSM 765]
MGHWGWLIAIYLFLGGLGAGAYLTSFAAEKGLLGKATDLKRVGYYVSSPLVAFGALLLVTDLGQGLRKPWLILNMFSNFRSVMTWGIYILSAFILIGFIKAYFVWKKKQTPGALSLVGAVLAVATAAYTGMLLAVVQGVPFWNSYLMPVIFVVSALSTGLSLTLLLAHFFEKHHTHEVFVSKVHLWLVSLEIIFLAAFFALIYSGGQGAAKLSANLLLMQSLSLPFWALLVFIGLIGPLAFYVLQSRSQSFASDGPPHRVDRVKGQWISLVCDGAVLIGGLTLRCLIVFAALPVWNGLLG